MSGSDVKFLLLEDIVNFQLNSYLLIIISLLLTTISIKLIFTKNLLDNIIILSVFSLLISLSYLFMDAPDVAMTEVALGACLSTCIYLSFLKLIKYSEKDTIKYSRIISSSIICIIFIIVLTWVGMDLPKYGSEDSPLQTHVSKYYIEHTKSDIGIDSFVAAILASYRAYDTLGEITVILIAGLAVLLIFSQKKIITKSL